MTIVLPGDMLGGEGDQVVGHVVDLAIGRHGSCRGECPALATLSLVPDTSDGTLLPPVNRGREILNLDVLPRLCGVVTGRAAHRSWRKTTIGIGFYKLLPEKIVIFGYFMIYQD